MQTFRFLIEFNCTLPFVFLNMNYWFHFCMILTWYHVDICNLSDLKKWFGWGISIRNMWIRLNWNKKILGDCCTTILSFSFSNFMCWFRYDFKSKPFNWTRRIFDRLPFKRWYLVWSLLFRRLLWHENKY